MDLHKKEQRAMDRRISTARKKRPRKQACTHRLGWKMFLRLDSVEEKGFGEQLPCVAFCVRDLEN